MELQGKKILFLGDSITEGHGTSAPEHIYWNVVGQLTGARCKGYGIGGTRIARQQTPSACERYDRYFGSRVAEMDPEADIVMVLGGTNDYGHGDAPLGHPADRTSRVCGMWQLWAAMRRRSGRWRRNTGCRCAICGASAASIPPLRHRKPCICPMACTPTTPALPV